jgi:hypothetical protein
VDPLSDSTVQLRVPLDGLAAGGYAVVVQATDGEHEARSRNGISIAAFPPSRPGPDLPSG